MLSGQMKNTIVGKQLNLDLATADTAPVDSVREPPVQVRHSSKAKHLQIRVSPWKGVEVIVPRRRSASDVQAFVTGQRDWIRRAWRRLLKEYPEAGALRLPEIIELPLLQDSWKVHYVAQGRLRETGGLLVVPHDGDSLATALMLQTWLKKKARNVLPARLSRWSARTGLSPEKVVIRGQATRWGSCSSRHTISLNFRLLFLEKQQVDCLLLHELCHLRHLNHGKHFWALMERHMPGARERDRALGEGWKQVPPWGLVR